MIANAEEPETPSVEPETEVVDALYEKTELRTVDTKYIQMSDDTVQALVYGGTIHRKDVEGVWQDIDNSLTEEDDAVYSDRVSFTKKIGEGGVLFALDDGEYKITLSLPDATVDTPVTVVNDGKSDEKFETKLEELSTLTKLVSSVRYNDILPGTDLEYILKGNDLKENVLISEPGENYIYSFEFALENLTAELAEDGSIALTDGEEVVYSFPAPYMYDAEGDFSDEVFYALEESGEGRYFLTVSASEEWINAEGRAFPVTVDPSIILCSLVNSSTETLIDDTYVCSELDNSFTASSYLSTGKLQSLLGYARAYVRVNTPVMPDLPLIGAEMKLYVESVGGSAVNQSLQVEMVEYTGAFSNLRYDTQLTETESLTSIVPSAGTTVTYDLLSTTFLKKVMDGETACYRIHVDVIQTGSVKLSSSESQYTAQHPMFVYKYGYVQSSTLTGTSHFKLADLTEANSPTDISNVYVIKNAGNGLSVSMVLHGSSTDPRCIFHLESGSQGTKIKNSYDSNYLHASAATNGSAVIPSYTYQDEWLFLKTNSGEYLILLASDTRFALTRTTTGAITVSVLTSNDNKQLWNIYVDTTLVCESHSLDSGIYYINSNYTKTFLVNNNGALEMSYGTEAILGNKMAWQITYAGNGKYAVQSVESPNMFWTTYGLYMDEIGLSNSFPDHVTVEIEQIGSNYAFKTPVGNDYYYVNAWTYSVELDEYDNSSLWRLCKRSDYDELQNFQISTQQIPVGNTLTINEITSNLSSIYTYSTPNNFAFESIESTLGLSVSSQSVLAYEVITGNCEIRVRHLPTNQYCVIKIIISISDFVNSNSNINSMINRDSIYQYICDYNFSSYNNPQTGEDDTLKEDFNSSSYNNNYIYFDGHDCANFGSQCLFAGGLQFGNAPVSQNDANSLYNNEDSWYYIPLYGLSGDYAGVSETWRKANKLKKYWTKRTNNNLDRCYRYVEYNTAQQFYYTIDYWYNELKPGDMIFMYGPGETNAHHTIIVTATAENDILVSYHSTNRFCASLKQLVYNNSTERYCVVQIAA